MLRGLGVLFLGFFDVFFLEEVFVVIFLVLVFFIFEIKGMIDKKKLRIDKVIRLFLVVCRFI